MKITMAVLALALMVLAPLAAAQETAQADTQATADISVFGLQVKKLGEAFGDFGYAVRAALTFDQNAKVDLLKERNAHLQTRLKEWLKIKAEADLSGSAEEKQTVLADVRAKHEAIVQEHLQLTAQLREFQVRAKVQGNAGAEARAQAAAEIAEDTELERGLAIGNGNFTAEEVKAIVAARFRLGNATVTTETEGNTTVFVVSGTETRLVGVVTLTRTVVMRVNAETGTVIEADLNTNIKVSQAVSPNATATVDIDGEAELSVEVQALVDRLSASLAETGGSVKVEVETEDGESAVEVKTSTTLTAEQQAMVEELVAALKASLVVSGGSEVEIAVGRLGSGSGSASAGTSVSTETSGGSANGKVDIRIGT